MCVPALVVLTSAAFPNRLVGVSTWDLYDGISNHKMLLDSDANFEEFEVRGARKDFYIKAKPSDSTIRRPINGRSV
jgi:hypothetical protein